MNQVKTITAMPDREPTAKHAHSVTTRNHLQTLYCMVPNQRPTTPARGTVRVEGARFWQDVGTVSP